jgi:hypothetical protein
MNTRNKTVGQKRFAVGDDDARPCEKIHDHLEHLPPDQQVDYRTLAQNRRGLGWCLSEAAYIRRTVKSGSFVMDAAVEAGARHAHDLLCLVAAATPARDKDELLWKHDALANVKPLDPMLGHLSTVVNAALAADWRRLDDDRKYARDPFGLH